MTYSPEDFELANEAFANRSSRGLGTVKYDDKKQKYVYREPSPSIPYDSIDVVPEEQHFIRKNLGSKEIDNFRNCGLEAILRGEIGVLCLCGGQATRLGGACPKGVFDLGVGNPYNNLLRIQAGYICRLKRLARDYYELNRDSMKESTSMCESTLPRLYWYVMVSRHTKERVEQELNSICEVFDIPKDEIVVFTQNEVPAFDCDGKVIYSGEEEIAVSPNGNGGLFEVLQKKENIEKLKNVKYLHVYCVDNILCRVGDPVFMGMCIANGVHCAAKVVEKTHVDEKVGLVVKVKDHFRVLEYSEVPSNINEARSTDNKLKYRTGSIANHFFSIEFLNKVKSCTLPYHLALKNIRSYIPSTGKQGTISGYKLERFIFDVFPECETSKFLIYEVDRSEEFAPLKNAEGPDSPQACREAIRELHRQWYVSAGVSPSSSLFSPLTTYEGEGLTKQICSKMHNINGNNRWVESDPELVKKIYDAWNS